MNKLSSSDSWSTVKSVDSCSFGNISDDNICDSDSSSESSNSESDSKSRSSTSVNKSCNLNSANKSCNLNSANKSCNLNSASKKSTSNNIDSPHNDTNSSSYSNTSNASSTTTTSELKLIKLTARQAAIINMVDNEDIRQRYRYIATIGHGSFGDVIHIKDVKNNIYKAAKVVIFDKVDESEIKIWPTLKHEYILSVEELIIMPDKTHIFIMPLSFKSLDDIVLSDEFKFHYKYNHLAIKVWSKHILYGLNYMHNSLYCHFDMKINNIMIGHNGVAQICDFSCVSPYLSSVTPENVGLPKCYRPPELFKLKRNEKLFNGPAIDIWAFGLIIIEAYCQNLCDSLDHVKNYLNDINPFLRKLLRPKHFYSKVKSTLKAYKFKNVELKELLKFIKEILNVNARNRKKASYYLNHKYFENCEQFSVKISEIYHEIENDFNAVEGQSQNSSTIPNTYFFYQTEIQDDRNPLKFQEKKEKYKSKYMTAVRFRNMNVKLKNQLKNPHLKGVEAKVKQYLSTSSTKPALILKIKDLISFKTENIDIEEECKKIIEVTEIKIRNKETYVKLENDEGQKCINLESFENSKEIQEEIYFETSDNETDFFKNNEYMKKQQNQKKPQNYLRKKCTQISVILRRVLNRRSLNHRNNWDKESDNNKTHASKNKTL